MLPSQQRDIGDAGPDDASGDVCIPNISPAERRKRLRMGVVMITMSLVILAALVTTGASRWWRLPLLLLFAAAATGYFQWRDKTCVALARVNARKTGSTEEPIEDAAELAQVRRQARQVEIKAAVAAISLTLIALALPAPE